MLNKVVGTRGRLNSVLCNVQLLQKCLVNAVAPRGIQRRVRKSKVYHSARIERVFVRDELTKCRAVVLQARRDFQRLYRKSKEFLSFLDYIRFSWLLSECDRKRRSSLARNYEEASLRMIMTPLLILLTLNLVFLRRKCFAVAWTLVSSLEYPRQRY